MNLTNYYWYFQSAIPERVCDDIVRYGKQLQDQMSLQAQSQMSEEARDSDTRQKQAANDIFRIIFVKFLYF